VNPNAHNPYSAPAASFDTASAGGCYRKGKTLVVPFGADVPERCVKCDAPAELGKPRGYAWHHPAWYLTILLSPLIYIIAATIARKRAKVAVGLCEEHQARRSKLIWAGWAAFAIGVGSTVLSANDVAGGVFALVAVAGILSSLILYVCARLLTPTRITDSEIHLTGCCDAFLDGLGRH